MGSIQKQHKVIIISTHLPLYMRQWKTSKFCITGFVQGIHQWPVNSLHIWPVKRKMFPFDDVIMYCTSIYMALVDASYYDGTWLSMLCLYHCITKQQWAGTSSYIGNPPETYERNEVTRQTTCRHKLPGARAWYSKIVIEIPFILY